MADPADPANQPSQAGDSNRPALSLHVPEPQYRPGDTVDFFPISISVKPAASRDLTRACIPRAWATSPTASSACWGRTIRPTARGTRGSILKPCAGCSATWRWCGRSMNACSAASRQGKTSFYMKCTGEGSNFDRPGHGAGERRHGVPVLPSAGHPDCARLSADRDDQPDLFEQGRQVEGPPAADHVFEPPSTASSAFRATLATQTPQAVGWAMASAIKG